MDQRFELKFTQGLKPNGGQWNAIDIMLDGERLERSFLTPRELRHVQADPSALTVGFTQRHGQDGSPYEVSQLMLGSLAVGTRLRLNDVDKADLKQALLERVATQAAAQRPGKEQS